MLQMKLTGEERAVIKILQEAGLLHCMDRQHFINEKKEDVVIVSCSDGRQFLRGIAIPFMKMYDETKEIAFHPLTRHGGTLILGENSPLVPQGSTMVEDLVREFDEAVKWGYGVCCLIGHIPCGKAREHEIHPLHVVDSIMASKRTLKKQQGENVSIACFLQIADGGAWRDIFRIPYTDYLSWRDIHTDTVIDKMIEEMKPSCE